MIQLMNHRPKNSRILAFDQWAIFIPARQLDSSFTYIHDYYK